jgi:hypothetical protein
MQTTIGCPWTNCSVGTASDGQSVHFADRKWTAMSTGELEPVEVMGRVANEELKLTDVTNVAVELSPGQTLGATRSTEG